MSETQGLTEGAGEHRSRLGAYLSPWGACAFAIGSSIGWGSLVVTNSTYLGQAGVLGSVLGMLLGLGVMLLVAASYHFMMKSHPGTGGVYAYARDIFGYDHGVVVAWFLALTYIAIFWANATALPLFARYFLGGLFQFGPHYNLFGYEVYLGEALLSALFIVLAGFVCKLRKRGVSIAVTVMVCVIVVGVFACFAAAVAQYDPATFSFEPLFLPDSNALVQVLNIACMSSWAFIGFESISHSAGEFAFPHKRSFSVLTVSLVIVTALYIVITLLAVTAYPQGYGSWLDYIGDLGNISGYQGIPAFFAAQYYLGDAGVALLMAVLLCLIFTSLIGLIVALSRLLFSLSEDNVLPEKLAAVNENGVPTRAIIAIVVVSLVIPFLGRTAISWIVDVTTIGATIIYGFVCACALKDGRRRKNAVEADCGLIGLVLMVAFAAYLLLPGFLTSGAMATESYILFAAWSMLGFVFFRYLLRSDTSRRFGGSVVAWVLLLVLTLFTCMAWMGQRSDGIITSTVDDIRTHYAESAGTELAAMQSDEFAMQAAGELDEVVTVNMFVISGMLVFSLVIMLSNFTTMRRREEESFKEANVAHTIANTDPLTGVKSKTAYVAQEAALNAKLDDGALSDVGVVVCDVNGLKEVNDTQGHKAGDDYIRSASAMVSEVFKRSPVYRIGGDEFVVILQNADYDNREQLVRSLNEKSVANRDNGGVVVAAGLATFDASKDHEIHAVFERADAAMYHNKKKLKRGAPIR